MNIVLWSDSHSRHELCRIPDGDVLIFAGDIGARGTLEELESFDAFLGRLPHRRKIVIAGNRDYFFEDQPAESLRRLTHAAYLQDEETVVDGIRIFGSPWQPPFMKTAFNLPRGGPLREKWSRIPTGIDVLITHTPPMGIGDRTASGLHVGCEDLLAAVLRIRPRVHVFGHVHEGYGMTRKDGMLFVNASVVDERMEISHPPVVVSVP